MNWEDKFNSGLEYDDFLERYGKEYKVVRIEDLGRGGDSPGAHRLARYHIPPLPDSLHLGWFELARRQALQSER